MYVGPLFAIFLVFAAMPAFAAEPASTQPMENPNVPVVFGSGQARPMTPMPPHLPAYLPNGAANLDEDWIQDGCARPYWNDVLIPQQLRMDGMYWIDPALVPQLLPDKAAPAKRRYYKRRRARVKAAAPVNASSTALKSPAIPLPVTPAKEETPQKAEAQPKDDIPPLKATKARNPHRAATHAPRAQTPAPAQARVTPATTEDITIVPPPLQ